MEKNKLTSTINGRTYTFVSEETPEYMEKLCNYLNENIQKVKQMNPTLLGERHLVLAALNICDELYKAKLGGKVMLEKAQKNYEEIVAENKRLRGAVNNSGYALELTSLQRQLEEAKREIQRLKGNY